MKRTQMTGARAVAFAGLGLGVVAATVGMQRWRDTAFASAAPTASAVRPPEPELEETPPPSGGLMSAEAARALVAAVRAGRAPTTLLEAALPSGADLAPERRALFLDAQADSARLLAEAYRRQGQALSSALGEAPTHDAMPVEVLHARIADIEALAQAHGIVAGLYARAAHP